MKKVFTLFGIFILFVTVKAQNPGDTIIVKSFNHASTTRDTVVAFPTDSNLTFSKVLVYYNLRCKNASVSTPSQSNLGCGEWDYSCNTYLHDSARVDSFASIHPDYTISGYSGTTFNYKSTAMNSYYQHLQQNVGVDSIISETQSTVGVGVLNNDELLPANQLNVKRQYLYTQTELVAAGAHAGDLDGLLFTVSSGTAEASFLRIRMKQSLKTFLTDSIPDNNSFVEVYFKNTQFIIGSNRLQFYTPFVWDGISNVIVVVSYSNSSNNFTSHFKSNFYHHV